MASRRQVAKGEELFGGKNCGRQMVAEEHAHDRSDGECIQNPRLLTGRESEARQVTEDQRQPGSPDKEL